MPETLVLLHGFSGTRRAWDGVSARLDRQRYRPLALELPGHGERADAPTPITFPACVEQVLAGAPARFALCGYSLGARVALHVALAAPERINSLMLIGVNPGIEDSQERRARLAADLALADQLETGPFEEFIERWRGQPLFAADPPAVGELARADQRRNRPAALAAAMRGLSVGAMDVLWGRLGELAMPVTILNGARDAKFVAIGERIGTLLAHGRVLLAEGGHGLPLENPEGVVAALEGIDAEPRS